MPKFQRLLLDANVVIYAHELGIWDQLTDKYKITLTKTVVEEANYWRDNREIPHPIDLDGYIEQERFNCVIVPLSQLDSFRKKFGPFYLDQMDAGEADSLVFLYYAEEKRFLCSSDGIVYKVLGSLGIGEQGISLEEILQKIGLGRQVKSQYTKQFRLQYTQQGQQNGITGMGLKQPPLTKK